MNHSILRSLAFCLVWTVVGGVASPKERPPLIVILSIDQMRADYLVQFAPLYTAGFRKLLTEGVHFRVADLNYAISSTGPGHASLGTGVYPWKSGIVSNNFVDRRTGQRVYCVSDSMAGPIDGDGGFMSPRNLLVPGFGDWIKAASPSSKVISISYKDRAAILMGGKKPNAAYWFDRRTGHMASSSYYFTATPEWVSQFNSAGWIAANLPRRWTRLFADSVYDRFGKDDVNGETPWNGKNTFPHEIESGKEVGRLFDTPWGNDYLLDFAETAIVGEDLGKRGSVDVLFISLSTTDNIGTDFGPSSHEMIDNLARIDRALGKFLTRLEDRFGAGGFVLALTGDHGVMPLPEYATTFERLPARRIDNEAATDKAVKALDAALRSEFGIKERIFRSGTINYPALQSAGAEPGVVEKRLRDALTHIDGVAGVLFGRVLAGPDPRPSPIEEKFRHSYFSQRSPDYYVLECEYCLVGEETTGTGHGTPYAYDTEVPLLFFGTGLPARVITRPVHTVDMVATLARWYGIPVSASIDGVPLKEIVE